PTGPVFGLGAGPSFPTGPVFGRAAGSSCFVGPVFVLEVIGRSGASGPVLGFSGAIGSSSRPRSSVSKSIPDLGFGGGDAASPVSSDIPNRSSTSRRLPAFALVGEGGFEARTAPRGGFAGAGDEPTGPVPPRRDGATGGS